jgi:hypothetical protein
MSFIRLTAALFLSIVASSLGAAEPSGPPRISPSDETSIRELETMSWVAWKSHDAPFFERFLSDDHVEVHPYGIVGKAAVVDGVRSPACVVESYSLGAFSMTAVSQDTVLVTYRAEQNTQCGGLAVPSPAWATSLYVRRAGRWLNILFQQTPVARS